MNEAAMRDDFSSDDYDLNKNENCMKYPERNSSMVTIKKSSIWSTSSSSFSESPSNPPPIMKRRLNSFRQYLDDDDEGFTEDENIPKSIDGTYTYDYNIFLIDEILRKKFKQEKKNNLVILRDKLREENKRISEKQNMIERKTSRKKIDKYQQDIERYENNIDENTYEKKARPLLDAYEKIGPLSTVISFTSIEKENNEEIPEDPDLQNYRHEIIFKYLECARKFIPINLVRELQNNNTCPCGVSYDEVEIFEDDFGSSVCPNCGIERIKIVRVPFFSDGSRYNNSRNSYEDRANFEKVLLRFQGKQITKPEKILYEKLDEYFISRGLSSSKEYHMMPLLSNGKKAGTSKELMFESLAAIKCSGYYDDINLICNIFFGWKLPDISHLENAIMKDYDMFQKVYESLDLEGRKSSLNSQWKLYILLRRRNYPCKAKDFKIPRTPHILEYHKTITKKIYEILNWDYNI